MPLGQGRLEAAPARLGAMRRGWQGKGVKAGAGVDGKVRTNEARALHQRPRWMARQGPTHQGRGFTGKIRVAILMHCQ